jgi:RNA 3'-terminal phosphate cyclase
LPGSAHHLIDVEVADGTVLSYEIRQIRLRLRHDPVSLANDKGNTFGFELHLLVTQMPSVRYVEGPVDTKMSKEKVGEFVRQRHEANWRSMVFVDEHPIDVALFVVCCLSRAADRAGLSVARVEIIPKSILAVCPLPKRFDLSLADGAVGEEGGNILRQLLPLCVGHIIHKRDRTEWPQHQ